VWDADPGEIATLTARMFAEHVSSLWA